jgi:hypothetical protein
LRRLAARSAALEAVLAYLSRYIHRVAIANSRLIAFDERGVTFKWKDYRIEGRDRYKRMTLATDEFIRRFLIHVLPKGFHRIRHYGLLAKPSSANNIARARELLAALKPHQPADDIVPDHNEPACPCCGGRMIIIERFEHGATPCQTDSNQDRYLMTAFASRFPTLVRLRRWFATRRRRPRSNVKLPAQPALASSPFNAATRPFIGRIAINQPGAASRNQSRKPSAVLKSP